MEKNGVTRRLVAIGGSAGSLDVLLKIATAIPPSTGATYVIIVHRKSDGESILVNLLSTRTGLPVVEVEDKERLCPDAIYVAPADYHLLIEDEQTFCLDSSEKVHYSRPSIDVTFESVAEVFGRRSVGILLSGANADGASGLLSIRTVGGVTIAQDPVTADVDYMPQQAIALGAAMHVFSPEAIATFIRQL